MDTTLLQREAIVPDHDQIEEELLLGGLGREARDSLGYSRLFEEETRVLERRALRQTLANMDVLPFTPHSVQAYKESCVTTANRWVARIAVTGVALAAFLAIGAVPVLVFATLAGYASMAFSAAVIFVVSVAAGIVCGFVESRCSVDRKWAMHELSAYAEPIPEFVLQTAVDIKRAHPDAEFCICALEEDRVVADPFLVLRIPDGDVEHEYYLEVWNESRFDGCRAA